MIKFTFERCSYAQNYHKFYTKNYSCPFISPRKSKHVKLLHQIICFFISFFLYLLFGITFIVDIVGIRFVLHEIMY